jgi:hypothetical protein
VKIGNRAILIQSVHSVAPACLFSPGFGSSQQRQKIAFRIQNGYLPV